MKNCQELPNANSTRLAKLLQIGKILEKRKVDRLSRPSPKKGRIKGSLQKNHYFPWNVTTTCAVCVVTPVLLLAVRIYTFVSSGVTDLLPAAGTVPIPEMTTLLAPVTCHCKVVDSPRGITGGLAEKVSIKGRPDSGITVKVTDAVIGPAALVAVNVYVVVLAGDT